MEHHRNATLLIAVPEDPGGGPQRLWGVQGVKGKVARGPFWLRTGLSQVGNLFHPTEHVVTSPFSNGKIRCTIFRQPMYTLLQGP